MLKLKVHDNIVVLSGKDRGKSGVVEKVDGKKRLLLVPGVNIYKKHVKAMYAPDKKGGIFDIPRALPFSKVALVCPHCKKATRVGFRVEGEEKYRICKKCDRNIDLGKKAKKGKKQ